MQNKVVWITGASSGMGEELVYQYIKLGAKVVMSSENEAELIRVKNNCGENSSNCIVEPINLIDTTGISDVVKKIIGLSGKIDILINNAGISQRALVKESSIEIDRKIMEINFFGAIALTKAVLPFMLEKKTGNIAVTTSIAGKFGFPLRSAYCASKHALQGFFEALRAECHHDNIKITILIPGRVQTNISMHAIDKDGKPHGKMDQGQAQGITAKKAAAQIIHAIRKNRKEVLIGGKELIMVYIRRFLPRLFFYLAPRIKST